MRWTRALFLPATALLVTGCASVAPLPAGDFDHDVRRSVQYLASDGLEGRGLDNPGADRAADYIAGVFRQIGAEPMPALGGYFQNFDMTVAASVGEETSLQLSSQSLDLGSDFVPVSFSTEASFDAPVVFVGYGIRDLERGYDDYAGVDVKGKVALAMRFEPHNAQGKSRLVSEGWSAYATLMSKARAAADQGAVALILVNPPAYHGMDSLLPFAATFKGTRSKIPVLHLLRSAAPRLNDLLLELQSTIDRTGQPASRPLEDLRAAGTVEIRRRARTVRNVIARLPGGGPHADEYVVVGAHYDHLGHGTLASMTGSQEIHNGADDNASGVAAMLELAERLRDGPALDRSVIFVAFTAEEWGLIGSQHFVAHPPAPLEKIVAMVNMDMVGRMRNDALYVGGYGTAAPLKSIIDSADARAALNVKTMGAGGFGPSDHMTFALKKIPVLFFFSGIHGDYHRPTDDADKINYRGIEKVVDFAEQTVRDLSTMPRAQYVETPDGHQTIAGFKRP